MVTTVTVQSIHTVIIISPCWLSVGLWPWTSGCQSEQQCDVRTAWLREAQSAAQPAATLTQRPHDVIFGFCSFLWYILLRLQIAACTNCTELLHISFDIFWNVSFLIPWWIVSSHSTLSFCCCSATYSGMFQNPLWPHSQTVCPPLV